MKPSPSRDLVRIAGGLGLLLFWAAPEKLCPWLDDAAAASANAARNRTENETGEDSAERERPGAGNRDDSQPPSKPGQPSQGRPDILAAPAWPDAVPPRWLAQSTGNLLRNLTSTEQSSTSEPLLRGHSAGGHGFFADQTAPWATPRRCPMACGPTTRRAPLFRELFPAGCISEIGPPRA